MTDRDALTLDWLAEPALQTVFDALEAAGGTVRVAGGAVRNTLLGEPIADIDLSTTLLPTDTLAALEAAGLKAVKTGFEHGTVTAVSNGRAYQVTTLREDIETDGRHAVVRYGTDWRCDAQRRDLTINALYISRSGEIHDPLGGRADLDQRVVRFIGDAQARIKEDYLRILRFFRFFAQYGAGRPNADGLRACARLREGLNGLASERVWQEMSKLLAAKDPSRALLWMRQTGVLTQILPESENWGIDAIHGLVDAEAAFGWSPDPVLRLMSIVPPSQERVGALSTRWKLPNLVTNRLNAWTGQTDVVPEIDDRAFRALLYYADRQAVLDRMRLDIARRRARRSDDMGHLASLARLSSLLETAEQWQKPTFPLTGKHLVELGVQPGKGLGDILARAEGVWVDTDFAVSRQELLATVIPNGQADD